MKHNYSKTFHQKKELAVAIELQEDLINRLFLVLVIWRSPKLFTLLKII